MSFVRVRPIQHGELETLVKQAASDGDHHVIGVTDLVTKDGKVIGYMSIGGITYVHGWMDTRVATARDSYEVLRHVENSVLRWGNDLICIPVPAASPLHDYLPKVGYTGYRTMTTFYKRLT
jgi:hypothetical protein